MPTIGIVGITIPGAADCLNKINQISSQYFPIGEHPNIVLHQMNFSETHHAQNIGRWDIVESRIIESIDILSSLGVDFIVIPANTVHRVIDSLMKASITPIINLLDVVANTCKNSGFKKVGILGTRWTMKEHLYCEPLKKVVSDEVVPCEDDQEYIQHVIIHELIPHGAASKESINGLIRIVNRLKEQGCDGVALACTELPLVLNEENCSMPVLDTTKILANAAVEKAALLCQHNNCYSAT